MPGPPGSALGQRKRVIQFLQVCVCVWGGGAGQGGGQWKAERGGGSMEGGPEAEAGVKGKGSKHSFSFRNRFLRMPPI